MPKDCEKSIPYFLVVGFLLAVLLVWIGISPEEKLVDVIYAQYIELCNLVGETHCAGWDEYLSTSLVHPDQWGWLNKTIKYLDESVISYVTTLPQEFLIGFFEDAYWMLLILMMRLPLFVFCAIIIAPLYMTAWKFGTLKVKINRSVFKEEHPSLMRVKFSLMKSILVVAFFICLIPLRIKLNFLLILVGVIVLVGLSFFSFVRQTNQP